MLYAAKLSDWMIRNTEAKVIFFDGLEKNLYFMFSLCVLIIHFQPLSYCRIGIICDMYSTLYLRVFSGQIMKCADMPMTLSESVLLIKATHFLLLS